MFEFFSPFVFGLLNRIRGGGFGGQLLPGRPLFWVTPAVALLASYLVGLYAGAIFATIYLIWAAPPWGRWFTFGRIDTGREITTIERWIEYIPSKIFSDPFKFNFACFSLRNFIFLLPIAAMYYFIANIWLLVAVPVMAVAITILYATSWFIWDDKDERQSIQTAEILTGILWGIVLILIPYL